MIAATSYMSSAMPLNEPSKINPDMPEAHKLRGWFKNHGFSAVATSISSARGPGGLEATRKLFNFCVLHTDVEVTVGHK